MSLKEQLKYASQETISLKKLVELWAEETGEDQNTVFRFVTYLLRKLLRKDPHAFFWLRKDPDAFLFYDPLDSASIAVARRHAEKRRLAEKLIGRPRERPDKQVRLMFEHGIQKA